jgi:pyruvate/2-oxoglutarate dehydrogenase complex dihydrolipoamide dehydrogenase (E3) component
MPSTQIPPADEHNCRLAANVDVARVANPTPASRYNLVVIGAGTAGLVTAAGAAGLGAKVALVERHLMGGDCLNYGCVPSKALLSAARAAAARRGASSMGIAATTGEAPVDFGAVMERMRRIRAELSVNDSVARFTGLGVDVFQGQARFTGRDRIEVGGQTLRFSRAAITTGARAAALPIAGLAATGYLTNETVFALQAMPRRLAVIGAGPIGCELAQAFRRFGADVTVLEVMPRILLREDPDAAERIARALTRDGVEVLTASNILDVATRDGAKLIRFTHQGTTRELVIDEIILGVGRAPNVEDLGLEAAGVEYGPGGIRVDDRLRTSNPRIYAAGDVATPLRFTHVADAMARIVIRNALFRGRAKISDLTIPWCIYTSPEIAQVGLTPADAEQRGIRMRTFTQEFSSVDRAVIDGETEGIVKVHVGAKGDKVLGATIVANHASEMITELTLAIRHRVGLGALAEVIHPYPTQVEAIPKLGDAYNRTRLTPFVKRLFAGWLRLTRTLS